MPDRPYLTTRQCAQIVGCPTWKIRHHIQRGMLEAIRLQPPPTVRCLRPKPIILVKPEALEAYVRSYCEWVSWRAVA